MTGHWRRLLAVAAVAAAVGSGCDSEPGDDADAGPAADASSAQPAPSSGAPPTPPPTSPEAAADPLRVLATGLAAPWGVAFLPDGTALVTERDSARLLRVTPAGRVSEVQRIEEATDRGEGGLLGVAVSPTYQRDRWVYVYYTTGDDNRIARLRLGGRPEPIVTGIPAAGIHNGGRIAFGPDGMLYAGTGDASERGRSQEPGSLGGKILRMTPAGRPAPGNPDPNSLVWTLGHRNVQGLAWDSAGRLWATEFGQNQYDEVNLVERGRNYGWPEVEGPSDRPEYAAPKVTWNTAEASPSGAAVLGRNLYVAALRGERLWQVPLDGRGGTGTPRALLAGEYGRLRHAAVAPDGSLWVLTSNRDGRGDPQPDDDRILRVTP